MERAELKFFYGTMGSAKSLSLLVRAYKKRSDGKKILSFKSAIDTRDNGEIKSRALPVGIPATIIHKTVDILNAIPRNYELDHIFVDEANFLTEQQIEMLAYLVDEKNIPVTCFGLLTDFQGKMFPGSQRLVELADSMEEIPHECKCGGKASRNMRLSNGVPTIKGEQIAVGGDESYVSVCRSCYRGALKEHGII